MTSKKKKNIWLAIIVYSAVFAILASVIAPVIIGMSGWSEPDIPQELNYDGDTYTFDYTSNSGSDNDTQEQSGSVDTSLEITELGTPVE